MTTVLFRPDLAPQIGVGHVMRSMALAEELVRRGHRVVFACDFGDMDWLRGAVRSRQIETLTPDDARDVRVMLNDTGAQAAVVDSYTLPSSSYEAVLAAEVPLLAFVDNELRGARADLYLDQNIGVEADWSGVDLPAGGRLLAGLDHAVIRREIRDQRPAAPPTARQVERPEVLVFFGGSDALGVGPDMARLLAATGKPFHATVITRPDLLDVTNEVSLQSGQTVEAIPPVTDLHERVRRVDLVVAAAGSSSWELATLGAAAAVVPVAPNQVPSCARMVSAGAFGWLGELAEIRAAEAAATSAMALLLTDADRRQQLHDRSWRLVDGRGVERVADALVALF